MYSILYTSAYGAGRARPAPSFIGIFRIAAKVSDPFAPPCSTPAGIAQRRTVLAPDGPYVYVEKRLPLSLCLRARFYPLEAA